MNSNLQIGREAVGGCFDALPPVVQGPHLIPQINSARVNHGIKFWMLWVDLHGSHLGAWSILRCTQGQNEVSLIRFQTKKGAQIVNAGGGEFVGNCPAIHRFPIALRLAFANLHRSLPQSDKKLDSFRLSLSNANKFAECVAVGIFAVAGVPPDGDVAVRVHDAGQIRES